MDRVMAALMVVADEHPTSVADLNFALVRPSEALRPSLREDLLETWVAVTETGGLWALRLRSTSQRLQAR
jgi:hypothetical protein